MNFIKRSLQILLVFTATLGCVVASAQAIEDVQPRIDDGVYRPSDGAVRFTEVSHRRRVWDTRQSTEEIQALLGSERCQKFFSTDKQGHFILDSKGQPILGEYGKYIYNLVLAHANLNKDIVDQPRLPSGDADAVEFPAARGASLCPSYAKLRSYDDRILAYTFMITALVATESSCDPTQENYKIGAVGFGQVPSQQEKQKGRYPDCHGSGEALKNPLKNLRCIVGELLENNMPKNGEQPYDLRTDAGITFNTQWEPMHRGQGKNFSFRTLVHNFPMCRERSSTTETAEAPAVRSQK